MPPTVLTGSETDSEPALSPATLQKRRRSRLRRVPLTVWIAGLFAVLLLIASLAPSVLATHDPRAINLAQPLQPPSWQHLLGTDQSGRDLYSRIVHGTAESLLIGFGAAGVGVGLAVIFGSWAGLGGRRADAAIGRGLEVLFAFPTLLLAMVFIAVYGPSASTLILAVGVGTAPGYTRMVRGQVLAVRRAGYVQAAQALGHSPPAHPPPAHPAQCAASAAGGAHPRHRPSHRVGLRLGVPGLRRRPASPGMGSTVRSWPPLHH